MDTRTQRNLAKLSEDLGEIHAIMTKNIAEVLGQGDQLNSEWRGGGVQGTDSEAGQLRVDQGTVNP
jgi:hypothetical protein